MRIIYKSKTTKLTPAIKQYLEHKLAGATQKLLPKSATEDAPILEIEFSRTTKHHHKGDVWRAEANLTIGKRMLRAEEVGEDPHGVIDIVASELAREIKSFKGKYKTKTIRGARTLKGMMKKPL